MLRVLLNLPKVKRTVEAQLCNVVRRTFISCACIEKEAYDLLTRRGMGDAETLAALHIKMWACQQIAGLCDRFPLLHGAIQRRGASHCAIDACATLLQQLDDAWACVVSSQLQKRIVREAWVLRVVRRVSIRAATTVDKGPPRQ